MHISIQKHTISCLTCAPLACRSRTVSPYSPPSWPANLDKEPKQAWWLAGHGRGTAHSAELLNRELLKQAGLDAYSLVFCRLPLTSSFIKLCKLWATGGNGTLILVRNNNSSELRPLMLGSAWQQRIDSLRTLAGAHVPSAPSVFPSQFALSQLTQTLSPMLAGPPKPPHHCMRGSWLTFQT